MNKIEGMVQLMGVGFVILMLLIHFLVKYKSKIKD